MTFKRIVTGLAVSCSFAVVANPVADDLFSMSLEELLNIEISTGSLESGLAKESPVALTIIRKEQIENSPARNLAVLLEQYVPGLIVMAHSQGDKIGMRGHIAAENYKLLLLVNGKNVTNMVYEGVFTEIDQWQLNDIEKVEVIRGPGSVTYGTGAIAGVINVITKKASDKTGFQIGVNYDHEFNSQGVDFQYSGNIAGVATYGYAAVRKTNGQQNPDYFQLGPDDSTDIRYVGKKPSDPLGPQNYLADTQDRPQLKAHLDLAFSKQLNAWFRYTQSGQSHGFVNKKLNGPQQELINSTGVSLRSFASNIEYQTDWGETSNWRLSATFDSQEYIRYDLKNPDLGRKSPANIKDYAFSQNRWVAQALYEHQFSEQLSLVAGYELNHIGVAAPWGKSDDHIWIREGVHFVSDAETSVYMQDLSLSSRPKLEGLEEVGSGLNFVTHTNLLEVSYDYSADTIIRYSHRLDLSDVSSTMFSPRLSLVSNWDDNNTWSIALQRAQRMAPLRAQYLFDKHSSDTESSKHEEQDTLELAYTNSTVEDLVWSVRGFYNSVMAVGYTGSKLEILNDNDLFGLEAEGHYKIDNVEFIFSHTYLDAFNITMNPELKGGSNRNNISFADYDYVTRGDIPVRLTGYGDNLNNIPNNVSKFIVNSQFMDGKLLAHINAQILWDLDGSEDERRMYQQAYDNYDILVLSESDLQLFDNQIAEYEREMRLLDQADPYEMNYMLSASLTYQLQKAADLDMKITIFANNLFDSFKRNYVSTGSTQWYPNRLSFINEPKTFGLKLHVKY